MPDPLHPALVHLPIGLAVVAPIAAIGIAWTIRSRTIPAGVWFVVVALQAAITLGGWAAFETGEHEEERVERVVAERFIEAHEEAAERFLIVAIATLVAAAAGLLSERRGEVGRTVAAVGSVLTLAAGASVGHLGGELVYVHGAASAYTQAEEGADNVASPKIDVGQRPQDAGDALRTRLHDD